MRSALISSLLLVMCLLTACNDSQRDGNEQGRHDIIILFDGDAHGGIEGYPKIAALKQSILQATPNVMLVSTGDFLQGSPLCSMTEGMGIVPIINSAGYDLISPGCHDFDFGLSRLRELADSLQPPMLSCNLRQTADGKALFTPYVIRDFEGTKVAFLGVVNPVTQGTYSPQSYYNEDGELIYTFCQKGFYQLVQQEIDAIQKKGVEHIVLLSHMGNSKGTRETADELISSTHGISAVLDSHDHKVVPERFVTNNRGEQVLIASTGTRLQFIGALTISSNGKIANRLIPIGGLTDEEPRTKQLVDQRMDEIRNSSAIGFTHFTLQGYDKAHGHYERNVQTNLGSLYADALRGVTGAEIGWINAGAISASIEKGDISMMNLLAVCPYGNQVAIGEVTGQQIIDGLEYATSRAPRDFGNFPILSGLQYVLDTTLTSSVVIDEMGFLRGVNNEKRRVSRVSVYSRSSQHFEPIDLKRKYRIASVDYILKNHGSGNIFDGCTIIDDDNKLLDIQAIQQYIEYMPRNVVSEKYNFTR